MFLYIYACIYVYTTYVSERTYTCSWYDLLLIAPLLLLLQQPQVMMQQQRKLVGYEPKYEMVNVPVQMQVRLESTVHIVCQTNGTHI